MLSRRERRRVREIEQRLAEQDPAFVSRMRVPPLRPSVPVLPVSCVAPAVGAPVLLLGGWPAVMAAVGAGAVVTGVVLVRRRLV